MNENVLNKEIRYDSTNTIKSVGNDQHAIIADIIKLYNNGNDIDADITYSTGNFYGVHGDVTINQPNLKFDVAPMDETITKIEPWGELPLPDKSIHSCMFDPPFVISPRDCPSVDKIDESDNTCMIFKRFSGYYPVNELLDSYLHWLTEMYRVLVNDGIAIVKCQPTVSGGKQLNSHHYIWFVAECLGFDVVDEFVLLAKGGRIISGKVKNQQHARKYHSYFYVLKKDNRKKCSYLNFMDDEQAMNMVKSFYNNNLGKKNGQNLMYRENVVAQRNNMNK